MRLPLSARGGASRVGLGSPGFWLLLISSLLGPQNLFGVLSFGISADSDIQRNKLP